PATRLICAADPAPRFYLFLGPVVSSLSSLPGAGIFSVPTAHVRKVLCFVNGPAVF
ncbi:unnamed protein product, partial [Staurois parvus]